MPPSPVVVEVPNSVAARPSASLTLAESAPKLMPAMVIGIAELDRLLREARAEHRLGRALLAIAFQRIARQRRAEEHQVVEMRQAAFGAQAADLVQARARLRAECSGSMLRSKPALSSRCRFGSGEAVMGTASAGSVAMASAP